MSDVTIDDVSLPHDLDLLRAVMCDVWGPEVVPPRNLLRGLALAGATLLIARRAGRSIGFALGWLGWSGGVHFHSHQVGVLASERSSGVGLALKLAQRDRCLANGIDEMRWTFDPLLDTNARFNLVRLGATVVGFLPDCYGERVDAFNTGDRTDRVEVSWRLDAPIGGRSASSAAGVSLIAADPRAERSKAAPTVGAVIPIPTRYHELRVADPEVAAAWRDAVGAALSDTFAAGLGIDGFGPDGYVVGEYSHRSS